jgi:MFS family permease
MNESVQDVPAEHDPYGALRLRNFRLYVTGNCIAVLGLQMQTVAVGWEIYERTQSNLALGLVGLTQFIPTFALALSAGQIADRMNRKAIVMAALALIALASLGLVAISAWQADVGMMYGCLFLSGMARAFQQPAKASLLPQIVPPDRFANAVTWSTGGFHLASVLGPAVGGLIIAWGRAAAPVYLLDAVASLVFLMLLVGVRARPSAVPTGAFTLRALAAGLGFLRRNQVIFGAITLDMFAVLLGGATTLLPVYAEDILSVGPTGLGCMRTAPALGALGMALVLAHRPPFVRAGTKLLAAVAGFGVATILFGLSRSYAFSLLVLFVAGALDNVSVVIRHTLVQVLTPDELRGRVSAVNGLFIGASNELGGFESGLFAYLFSPTISVVGGGVGTLAVVAIAALAWPRLREYGTPGGVDQGVPGQAPAHTRDHRPLTLPSPPHDP